MKIIRPITVTTLTSNVPQGNPGTYDAGTTYALGDRVGVLTGTLVAVYESLQNSNTGNAPASSPLWWQFVANTYVEWDNGTTYADNDIVILASTKRKYESQVGSNLGNNPATDGGTNWIDIGPTNRWAMFDAFNGTATAAQNEIDVTVTTTGRVDSVGLLEISGTSVQIIATSDAVEVYNQTYNLADFTGITDWYEYFFAEIGYKTDLIVTDLPVYSGMEVQVVLSATAAQVSCGNCVIGLSRELGTTVQGTRVGIIDYSRKQADDFGGFTIVQRAFSKRMDANVVIHGNTTVDVANKVDAIQKLLAQYRATPVLWVGSADYGSTAIFGFFREFETNIAYPLQSDMTLSIEGLT